MSDICLRPATESDLELLYAIHREAMKGYIEQTWGAWDESWQARRFREQFDTTVRRVIRWGDHDVGFIDVEPRHDGLWLASIEIAPAYQRRGIGTFLLRGLIGESARCGGAVGLQVLKVNPARVLYERLGFRLTGETETHYLMKHSSTGAQPN